MASTTFLGMQSEYCFQSCGNKE